MFKIKKGVDFWLSVVQFILFIGGMVLIVSYSSWQVALGVFLLIWANNFDFKKEEK